MVRSDNIACYASDATDVVSQGHHFHCTTSLASYSHNQLKVVISFKLLNKYCKSVCKTYQTILPIATCSHKSSSGSQPASQPASLHT